MGWTESLPLAVWVALHLGGLLTACLSRASLGGRLDAALQTMTLAGFILVAAAAVLASTQGGDLLRLWVLSGTTLGAMVVATLFERQTEGHDPVLMRFAASDD